MEYEIKPLSEYYYIRSERKQASIKKTLKQQCNRVIFLVLRAKRIVLPNIFFARQKWIGWIVRVQNRYCNPIPILYSQNEIGYRSHTPIITKMRSYTLHFIPQERQQIRRKKSKAAEEKHARRRADQITGAEQKSWNKSPATEQKCCIASGEQSGNKSEQGNCTFDAWKKQEN